MADALGVFAFGLQICNRRSSVAHGGHGRRHQHEHYGTLLLLGVEARMPIVSEGGRSALAYSDVHDEQLELADCPRHTRTNGFYEARKGESSRLLC